METKIINCDACRKVIAGSTWEDAPGVVIFQFGHPEQNYVTTNLQHVCYSCRQTLKAGVQVMLAKLKPSTPPQN